tara:strand:- start:80 stop:922 length:843 start_codon:yes stop_codon:yes gene_type:complete
MADQRKGKRYAHYDPAYEAYIRRLLERQQGVSAPEGSEADYYAPPLTKYVDPRDKYAGSPVASGIANVLGGILQPGRASNIEEMNRQHFESLPQQQAQQSSLLTDSQLEALKQKALGGGKDAKDAQRLLATYVRALNPSRTGTSGPDWSQFQMGVAGRDTEGLAKPLGDGDDTTEPTLTGIRGNLTPAENLESVENQLSVAKEKLVRLEKELREGGKDMGPLNPRMRGKFKTYKEGELIEAEAEKTATENNIRNLEFTLETYRRPAAGAGGPGRAGQEAR